MNRDRIPEAADVVSEVHTWTDPNVVSQVDIITEPLNTVPRRTEVLCLAQMVGHTVGATSC